MTKKSETKKVFEHNKGTKLPVTPKDRDGSGPARSVPHVTKSDTEKELAQKAADDIVKNSGG